MSITEFAMVEELANLVKDNLYSKHLVLSMEETFLNFLLQGSSLEEDEEGEEEEEEEDGVLELQPMDPYNRLLLHRLADIFGFAHESVGEGEHRRLILQRCAETSIPSILVSDILFQYDESHSPTTSRQLLRRKDAPPVLHVKSPSPQTLEEREVAYSAARDRIFSRDEGEKREPIMRKPRDVPVVARRMIDHALGRKTNPQNQENTARGSTGHEARTNEQIVQDKGKIEPNSCSEAFQGTDLLPGKNRNSFAKAKSNDHKSASSQGQRNFPQVLVGTDTSKPLSGTSRNGIKKGNTKEEHLVAAKRMFAHALGRQSAGGDFHTRSNERKELDE